MPAWPKSMPLLPVEEITSTPLLAAKLIALLRAATSWPWPFFGNSAPRLMLMMSARAQPGLPKEAGSEA